MKTLVSFFFAMVMLFPMSQAQTKNFDTSKFHEFDFWLGEWTVYRYGTDTITGHSKITSIIDSLGIQEFYRTPDGKYFGTSLNKYNAANGQWEQFWIDNSGFSLFIRGGIQSKKMVLQDVEQVEGKPVNRITWTPDEDGSVRQTWDVSKDNGNSWNTVFDGKYVRK